MVATGTASVGAAPAASRNDRDVARTAKSALVEMATVWADLKACGCADQVGIVEATALRWMKQLNRVRASTQRGQNGSSAAVEALRNFGYAAFTFELALKDYALYPGSPSVHYDLYVKQYNRAVAYAGKAMWLLGIHVP